MGTERVLTTEAGKVDVNPEGAGQRGEAPSPGKGQLWKPFLYCLPTLSVCLRLQQKQRKKTLNWQEISPDKKLPSSGGGRQPAQEARKLGEALKKCQPDSAAEPSRTLAAGSLCRSMLAAVRRQEGEAWSKSSMLAGRQSATEGPGPPCLQVRTS